MSAEEISKTDLLPSAESASGISTAAVDASMSSGMQHQHPNKNDDHYASQRTAGLGLGPNKAAIGRPGPNAEYAIGDEQRDGLHAVLVLQGGNRIVEEMPMGGQLDRVGDWLLAVDSHAVKDTAHTEHNQSTSPNALHSKCSSTNEHTRLQDESVRTPVALLEPRRRANDQHIGALKAHNLHDLDEVVITLLYLVLYILCARLCLGGIFVCVLFVLSSRSRSLHACFVWHINLRTDAQTHTHMYSSKFSTIAFVWRRKRCIDADESIAYIKCIHAYIMSPTSFELFIFPRSTSFVWS